MNTLEKNNNNTRFKFDLRLFYVDFVLAQCFVTYDILFVCFHLQLETKKVAHTVYTHIFATVSANVIYPTESAESDGKWFYREERRYIDLLYAVVVEER